MKQYLLPTSGVFYKANLHCHTNISDGKFSPEEIKQFYKAAGYSIVAYTDHEIMIPHPELADEDFLPLTSFEIDFDEDVTPGKLAKTCHVCLIALDPDNVTQPFFHRTKYMSWGNMKKYVHLVKFDASLPDYERVYSAEAINAFFKAAKEKGFYAIYNHPTWSLEDYPQYISYEGMDAMEVVNYAAVVEGCDEHNERVYNDMLRAGKRVFCVATDDNHQPCDQFGGFTMIKAEKLEYKTVTDALQAGHFYASEGPKIHDLWYEDGKVHITCDPADHVFITMATRRSQIVHANEYALVTEAEFIVDDADQYFYITVVASDGKRAYTHAYFMDELNK